MAVVVKQTQNAADQIPDGIYKAKLSEVRQFSNHYGERIGFVFTVANGETVMRSTAPNFTPQSKLADVVQGLLGRQLRPDEYELGIDLSELVGNECQLLISQCRGKNGSVYSNVEKVFQ